MSHPLFRSLLLCLSILGLAATPALAQGDAGKPKPAPAKKLSGIGFIELNQVFDGSKAIKDALEKADADRTQRIELLREREKGIGALIEEKEKYAQGSREFFEKEGEIEKLRATLKIEAEIIKVEYDLAVVRLVRSTFKQVRELAKEIAGERGFDAVAIYYEGELAGRTYREATAEILTRTFLWLDEERDITAEIIERMNR